ncbi:MAG: phosphotransferase [Pseudorhodoplanes sp.]|nr:phosphotransferase [Pseudorhodoplanes sp.]
MRNFVLRSGLVDPAGPIRYQPLTGGVASDIWRVENGPIVFCVKRALPKLRVVADWRAPVERSRYEAEWLKGASVAVPGAAPRILAEHPDATMFAMEYLAPLDHSWWKADLLAGKADVTVARAVGERLGHIHAAFARDPGAPERFPTDRIFYDIRLEPYLIATARVHPDLAPQLEALAARTAATKRTVAHGDVSPKNILVGPRGPVMLDAECAWFGDPAFDVAFCLNHLLLKCLVRPKAGANFLRSFDALKSAYFPHVDWESAQELEARAASLLPGLFLARVDGKSPVEYLTDESDKNAVRRVARALLADPPWTLDAVAQAWRAERGISMEDRDD